MIFSLLRSDLIAIDPKQDKIKCAGIINVRTIVKYFTNMKTLKEKKKN